MEPTSSPASPAATTGRATARTGSETLVAGLLFVIALANFLPLAARAGRPVPAAIAFFVLLAGTYLGLTIGRLRLRLARALSSTPGALVPPAALLAAIVVYGLANDFPLNRLARDYAVYLFVPVLIALSRPGGTVTTLLGAAAFWLPLEFRWLPPIPLPASPGGYDASHLVGLVNGLCLFLVTRPLGGVGYTFRLCKMDAVRAVVAFALFAGVALPIGLATGFLAWNPRASAAMLLGVPAVIYLGTGIPEEFLFRGVIQNACARRLPAAAALAVASIVFGLAHLPDPRYAVLAALAGVAYGWVYWRTGKITASAITHALVDWVWALLLRR